MTFLILSQKPTLQPQTIVSVGRLAAREGEQHRNHYRRGADDEEEQEEEEEAPWMRNNKAPFHLPPLISNQRLRQEVVTLNGALYELGSTERAQIKDVLRIPPQPGSIFICAQDIIITQHSGD
jgi:hypothetical protein